MASAVIALPDAEVTTLDGDLPVSVREWRRAVKGYNRRPWLWQLLLLWFPLTLFFGVALVMFRQLTTRLQDVFAVTLQQRLPLQAVWSDGLLVVDRVLAAFDLSEEVALAQWWSVALVSLALLLLGAAMLAVLALLNRLVVRVSPRTRADLRVHQRLVKAQFRTIIPALITAGFLYMTWLEVTALASLPGKAPELDFERLIDSGEVLIAVLIGLAVLATAAQIATFLRRQYAPREHLLHCLGRTFASLLVTGLILLMFFFAVSFVFPLQVVPAIDRFVLARLETRVVDIALEHGFASPAEIGRIIRDLPMRLPLEKAPMIQDIMDQSPIVPYLRTVTVLWLAATALLQGFAAWLVRGISRSVWSAAFVVGSAFLLAVVAGWPEPVYSGTAGIAWIMAYVLLACAATAADLFLNPANSPRRAATDDPGELALARVRLQEGGRVGEGEVERARRAYAGVGCALDGGLQGCDG